MMVMNLADFLMKRGVFGASENSTSTYTENVKNLKAYDKSGGCLSIR